MYKMIVEQENPFLSDSDIERILTSFIRSRQRQNREVTEEECQNILKWFNLSIINYETFQMLLKGKIEIEAFENDGDISYILAEQVEFATPILYDLMKDVDAKFKKDFGEWCVRASVTVLKTEGAVKGLGFESSILRQTFPQFEHCDLL